MKFSKLVENVSKKQLPSHVKHLIVEVMVTDEEGEDVEVRSSIPLEVLARSAHDSNYDALSPLRYRSLLCESKSSTGDRRRSEDSTVSCRRFIV